MLQTNLIGRRFSSRLDKSVFKCVAVYVAGGGLCLLGETQRGSLVEFPTREVILMETPRGVDDQV